MHKITMTFTLKEGSEAEFKKAVDIIKAEGCPSYKGLVRMDAYKTAGFPDEPEMAQRLNQPLIYVLEHDWEDDKCWRQFIQDTNIREKAFSIFDGIQLTHKVAHFDFL